MKFSSSVTKKVFALMVLSFYLLSPVTSWACTAIMVGKNASTTGRVLIARTEDSRPEAIKKFIVVPAGFYKAGVEYVLDVERDFRMTFTRDSYKYTAMADTTRNALISNAAGFGALGNENTSKDALPHWEDGFHFTFDSNGVNEKGFFMSATCTTSLRSGIDMPTITGRANWTYRTMTKAVLPTASNCKEAFEIIDRILAPGLNNEPGVRHQSSDGEIMFIADANEAWIIDIVGRYHYVACRLPDDSFTPVSNMMHTQFFDENDPVNFRSNFKPVTYAIEKGFARYQLDENGNKRVNIALTYGPSSSVNATGNTYRRWRGLTMFAPSQGSKIRVLDGTDYFGGGGTNATSSDTGITYPTFIKPDKKISPMDIAMFQRDRYAGTPFDSTYGEQSFNANGEVELAAYNRPIGTVTQQHTHIYDIGGNLPPEIGARFWNGRSSAETTVNLPHYGNITDTHPRAKYNTTAPNTATTGIVFNGRPVYDPNSGHSLFTHTAYLAHADRRNYVAPIQAFWRAYELKLYEDQEVVIEPELLRLYNESPAASAKFITDYTIAVTDRTFRAAEKIHDALVEHIATAPNTLFKIPAELIEPTINETALRVPTDDDKKAVLGAGVASILLTRDDGYVKVNPAAASSAPVVGGYRFNLPGADVNIALKPEQVAAKQTAAKLLYEVKLDKKQLDAFGRDLNMIKSNLAFVMSVGGKTVKLVGRESDALISFADALDKGIATLTLTSDGAIAAVEYILADGTGVSGVHNNRLIVSDGTTNGTLNGSIWLATPTTIIDWENCKEESGCDAGFAFGIAGILAIIMYIRKRSS